MLMQLDPDNLQASAHLREVYEQGHGSVRLRGQYRIEEAADRRGAQTVVITSIPGLNYTLEAADNLSDLHWVDVQTRPGVGNELTLQDIAPAPRSRFYRIRVE